MKKVVFLVCLILVLQASFVLGQEELLVDLCEKEGACFSEMTLHGTPGLEISEEIYSQTDIRYLLVSFPEKSFLQPKEILIINRGKENQIILRLCASLTHNKTLLDDFHVYLYYHIFLR